MGLKYFSQFLTDPKLPLVLKNTIMINLLGLVIGFQAPVILAEPDHRAQGETVP